MRRLFPTVGSHRKRASTVGYRMPPLRGWSEERGYAELIALAFGEVPFCMPGATFVRRCDDLGVQHRLCVGRTPTDGRLKPASTAANEKRDSSLRSE